MKTLHAKRYPEESVTQLGINSGQVWKFAAEIKPGDIILTPNPNTREVYIGKARGSYKYMSKTQRGCSYQHRRSVGWISSISRDAMSVKLKYSIGSLLSVFSLNDHAGEIQQLLAGRKIKVSKPTGVDPERIEKESRAEILERLREMDGAEFEHFIKNLLEKVGFEQLEVSAYQRDLGWDVAGVLSVRNVAQVSVRAQVKRQKSSVGPDVVNALRGTLTHDEHGLIVTTGSVTSAGREAAEGRTGLKRIMLVDGEELVDLVLDLYNELDAQYRELLNLKQVYLPSDTS